MKNNEYKKIFYENMYGADKAKNVLDRKNTIIDRLYIRFKKFELHREDAVTALIAPCGRLLDLGCGNGSFLFKVKNKVTEMHGVDISPSRISEAEELRDKDHKGSNISFKAIDIDEVLSYNDNYFDIITCIATFEHIYDPYSVIKEIRRILNREGILIIEVPNITWLPRRISFILGKLPKTSNEAGWDGGHLHYFTVASLIDFLEEHSFEIISVSGAGVFSGIRNWWVSMLSGDIIIKASKK